MSVADAASGSAPGVMTSKRSSGGVIASRLRASAKNANTSSGVPGEELLALQDVDAHHHGYGRTR